MILYERNKTNIGYLKVSGAKFKIKMNSDRVICDDCNERLGDEALVTVIPFMNSAYCEECGDRILSDCRPVDEDEESYQMLKEGQYAQIFLDIQF